MKLLLVLLAQGQAVRARGGVGARVCLLEAQRPLRSSGKPDSTLQGTERSLWTGKDGELIPLYLTRFTNVWGSCECQQSLPHEVSRSCLSHATSMMPYL